MAGNLLKFDVDPDDVLRRQFTKLEQSQLPYAVANAVNNTAFAVREEWMRQMPRVFDRPTPLTQRAIVWKPRATKRNPYTEVKVRDEAFKGTPPSKYLQAQVQGGQRALKPFERRLQAQGILPIGMQAVPGRGAPLDGYGNLRSSVVTQILSQLGAQREAGFNANQTDASAKRRRARKSGKRGEMFALKKPRGRLLPGVYERFKFGGASVLRSLLVFVRPAVYTPRYRIFDLAERLYRKRFGFEFERELAKAVQTSKFRGRG